MPKLTTFLSPKVLSEITLIAEKEQKNKSKIACELIELGLKLRNSDHSTSESQAQRKAELEAKHTEYLLRLIAICSNIMKFTYDPDKNKLNREQVENELELIRSRAQGFIDGRLSE